LSVKAGYNFSQEDISIRVVHKEGPKGSLRSFKTNVPVLEALGFSFYLGWIFLLYWGTPLAQPGFYPDETAHLLRIGMSVSVAICYLLCGICAVPLASKLGHVTTVACTVLFVPANGVIQLLVPAGDFYTQLLAWCITGVGHALILILWSKHLVLFNRKQLIFITSLSFIVAGILYVLISYLQPIQGLLATLLLPVISLIFYVQGWRGIDERIAEIRKLAIPQKQTRPLLQLYVYAATYCIALGFMGSYVSLHAVQESSIPFVGLANCLAGVTMLMILVRFKRDIARIIASICLPLMALSIFLFAFMGQMGQLVCIAFLFFLLGCNDIVNTTTVSKSSGLFGVDYIRTFGFGRFPNGIGVCVGWVIGQAVFFYYDGAQWGVVFASFLIVVLLIFANAFTFDFGSKGLSGKEGPVFAPQPAKEENASQQLGSKTGQALVTERTIDGVETRILDRSTVAAQMLIDEYSLSTRQAEVLFYLARGRNAEHIQEKLFISNHTAKSHIYAIYHKLNVHSQQELIDMIESLFED